MTRTLTLALAGLAAAAALTGCSGDDPAPTGSTATAPPPATTPAPAVSSPAAPPAAADAEGLCGFLEQEVSALQQAGSPGVARTRFTGDLGLWTVGGPGRQMDDATALDTLATRECPDARSKVLAVLQVESLNAALG